MNTAKMAQPLIPLDRIAPLLGLEVALLILGLYVGAWLIYKLLLRDTSQERHRNLKGQFKNLTYHLVFGIIYFGAFYSLSRFVEATPAVTRIISYLGLITLIQGCVVFVKTCRIFAFEYLFLSHMRVAVPVLLVNLFTFLLTALLTGWITTELFNVRLAPLIATSAIFSIVLGLALQDSLGNLFAGVALQFDKPYEIGDWIEIHNSGQKWLGQVQEISWRATVLYGIGDEAITIPNRIIAQSQVLNFAARHKPVYRSHVFRLPFDAPIDQVKKLMTEVAQATPGVSRDAILVFIAETSESWLLFKLAYGITDFGNQIRIGDQIVTDVVQSLKKHGIPLATQRIELSQGKTSA